MGRRTAPSLHWVAVYGAKRFCNFAFLDRPPDLACSRARSFADRYQRRHADCRGVADAFSVPARSLLLALSDGLQVRPGSDDYGRTHCGDTRNDERVNRDVNASICPWPRATRLPMGGWTISPASGDCNDYAVTKRHELVQKGLPAKAVRLAVVKTQSGIGHLVLVVSTKGRSGARQSLPDDRAFGNSPNISG